MDAFPFLRFLPGQWKRDGRRWHAEELALFSKQLDGVRDKLAKGENVEGFGRYMIEHQQGGFLPPRSVTLQLILVEQSTDSRTTKLRTSVDQCLALDQVRRLSPRSHSSERQTDLNLQTRPPLQSQSPSWP